LGTAIPGFGGHCGGYKIQAPKADVVVAIPAKVFPKGRVITLNDVQRNDTNADDPENFLVKNERSLVAPAMKNLEPGPGTPGLARWSNGYREPAWLPASCST
jgi:hypothetical protein